MRRAGPIALFAAALSVRCAPRPEPVSPASPPPFATPAPPAPVASATPSPATHTPPRPDDGGAPVGPEKPTVVQAHQVGTAPWLDSPPHVSCPAPLRAELDRLLAGVSAHASRSSGCFDGPGERTTVTLLAVQSSRGKGVRWVRIRYGAVKEDAGGMRGCANGGCKPPEPSWGIAEISIRFSPAAGGYVMTVPGKWPVVDFDLQPMTPLDQEHDGKCYGKTPPFSPAVVKGW